MGKKNNVSKDNIDFMKTVGICIDESDLNAIFEIAENTVLVLEDKKIKSNTNAVIAVSFEFMSEFIKYLAAHKPDEDDESTLVNFGDLLTLGIDRRSSDEGKEANFTPIAEAGQLFKFAIKDDAMTETDED
ncbi:MAG: hypothetical protein PHF63_00330 [Herbinix sp.]|nr:hypothetical protein [Herbinix sp.]